MNESIEARVHQFAPILKFGAGEHFFPMNAARYVSACSLHRWYRHNRSEFYLAPGQLALEHLHTLEDGDLFLVYADHHTFMVDDDGNLIPPIYTSLALDTAEAIKRIRREIERSKIRLTRPFVRKVAGLDGKIFKAALDVYGKTSTNPPTYYYRVLRKADYGGQYDVIQYWYFYAYNDWATTHNGNNDHEADWETVQLFFDDLNDPQPVQIVFSAHHGSTKRAWNEVEKIDNRPVVYVAPGSHANFPAADDFDTLTKQTEMPWQVDEALTIGLDGDLAWAEAIDLSEERWVELFRGKWGGRYFVNRRFTCFEKPGGAPRGPRWQSATKERPAWHNPVAWGEKANHVDLGAIIGDMLQGIVNCARNLLRI